MGETNITLKSVRVNADRQCSGNTKRMTLQYMSRRLATRLTGQAPKHRKSSRSWHGTAVVAIEFRKTAVTWIRTMSSPWCGTTSFTHTHNPPYCHHAYFNLLLDIIQSPTYTCAPMILFVCYIGLTSHLHLSALYTADEGRPLWLNVVLSVIVCCFANCFFKSTFFSLQYQDPSRSLCD